MLEPLIDSSGSLPWLAAYAAGMIDADGCIGIGKTFKSGREKYILRVDVSQSEKGLSALHRLSAEFGGAVYRQRRPSETQLAQYQWMLSGRTAAALLRAIQPHLLVKHAQAELGLCAWEVIAAAPMVGRVKWTPLLCEQVRTFKTGMAVLNRLGPPSSDGDES